MSHILDTRTGELDRPQMSCKVFCALWKLFLQNNKLRRTEKNFDRLKRALLSVRHSAQAILAERRMQNRLAECSIFSALRGKIIKHRNLSCKQISVLQSETLFCCPVKKICRTEFLQNSFLTG